MKNKKAQSVSLWITLILGVIILGVIFTFIKSQSGTTNIPQDLFTPINNTCIRVTDNCIIGTSFSVVNESSSAATGNFTLCGEGPKHYGLLLNDAKSYGLATHTLNASYTDGACTRIIGMTGTIVNYIPIMAAAVLLIFVAAFVK